MWSNALLWSQLTASIVAFLLCFCINTPLIVHLKDFGSHCLLFSNGTWRETDGKFIVDWASQAYCDYNVIWSIIAAIVAFVFAWQYMLHLCRQTDRNFLGAFLDVVLSSFIMVASLCGAIILTVGYQVWCNAITRRFEACEDATQNDIMDKDTPINIKNFYMQFGTAQFGAWACWVCWVGLSVFSVLKLCSYHQQENLRTSMAQERSRLVNDGKRDSI